MFNCGVEVQKLVDCRYSHGAIRLFFFFFLFSRKKGMLLAVLIQVFTNHDEPQLRVCILIFSLQFSFPCSFFLFFLLFFFFFTPTSS